MSHLLLLQCSSDFVGHPSPCPELGSLWQLDLLPTALLWWDDEVNKMKVKRTGTGTATGTGAGTGTYWTLSVTSAMALSYPSSETSSSSSVEHSKVASVALLACISLKSLWAKLASVLQDKYLLTLLRPAPWRSAGAPPQRWLIG